MSNMQKSAGPGWTSRGRELEALLRERILVLDGAMGTMIQRHPLTAEDFGGPEYEGCNENLVSTRPDVIRSIHAAYFEAGADIVETDTFGGTPLVLAEYGLADRAIELNEAAARLAREVAATFAGPRFVAGSMGPTTRAISVTGGVTFDEMIEHYRRQAVGLLRGGVDMLLLETAQDTLNVKAGIEGIRRAAAEVGTGVPLVLSATIEASGTMLGGQAIEAFVASVEHSGMAAVGLNCATGPDRMTDHVRTLSRLATCAVSCYPNAGLPDENGRYSETPESLAEALARFVEHGWINLVGGCCGTTPDHIRAIAAVARAGRPRIPSRLRPVHVSGIEYVACEEASRPLIVGERTNVNGSRKFRELIAAEKFEEGAEIARRQMRAGAQIIDVCLTSTDRDEIRDMELFLAAANRVVKAPLMIDAMDSRVFECALKRTQGKAILNSINLEDGEERFRLVLPLVRNYGAAVVVGCIDERGQAIDAVQKLEVAQRAYSLLTGEYGLRAEDILWDALVFPCASGDKNYVGSAAKTLDAVRQLKVQFPGTKTLLGISNVSFGLPDAGREVLNSAFLYHATKAGLDFAIVNSEKLVRFAGLSNEERRLSEDLLFNRGEDPAGAFVAYFRGRPSRASATVAGNRLRLPLDERLARAVVDGSKEGLLADLEEKLKESDALGIINGPLMKGMEEVGRLFNNNELIVAEVLQSAEVMKAAVSFLEKYLTHPSAAKKGKLLLATVKGDVHDIGKNLVEIILSNNGFEVIDLGIKVPPDALRKACDEHRPDLIGLSGLLVKSAQQMVATVEDLRTAGIRIPVLVGGAALTRKFTETRIRPAYGAVVIYAKDAMNGLDTANRLMDPELRAGFERDAVGVTVAPEPAAVAATALPVRGPGVVRVPPRRPPTLTRRVITEPVQVLWPYLNRQALYSKHLGLRGAVETLEAAGDPKLRELQEIVAELQARAEGGWIVARGVYQFFLAGSEGNDIILLDEGGREIERFTFPRQAGGEGLCLADFVAPVAEGPDSVALFVVTCGSGIRERAAELKQRGEYVRSHGLQSLAIESAEAFAECLHQRIRSEWGIADPAGITSRDLLRAAYTGIRVSFGYPACPDLADQDVLWRLLQPQEIGVELTDGYMMDPEASVSALVFHHPQARYFAVGEKA